MPAQLRQLFQNRAVICAGLLLGIVNLGISVNAAISMYYLKYIVGDVDLLFSLSVVNILSTLLLMPVLPTLMRRFGKLSLLAAGMVFQALSALWLAFLGNQATHPQVIAMTTITGLGLICSNTCCFALIPDCTDYTELHFGSAQAGFINATGTFMRKLCGALSTLIVGGLLSLAGYRSDWPVTSSIMEMILQIKIWTPLLLLALTIVLLRCYPITTAYGIQMRAALRTKRSSGGEIPPA